MTEELRKRLTQECKNVAENSLYTAQAHFEVAASRDAQRFWCIVMPALLVVGGILASLLEKQIAFVGQYKIVIDVVTALAAMTTALSVFMGLDRQCASHNAAANLFTLLRHDARSLHETFAQTLSNEEFARRVQELMHRYGYLCQATEPTDKSSFEKARKSIKGGIHEMDHQQQQTSKTTT